MAWKACASTHTKSDWVALAGQTRDPSSLDDRSKLMDTQQGPSAVFAS